MKRSTSVSLPAALALGLAACAAPKQFAQPDGTWSTRVGQARYASPKVTLIGEVSVATRGAQELALDFRKGPSVPLITVRTDGIHARYEGALARQTWQGPVSAPVPPHLRLWQRAAGQLSRGDAAQLRVADGDTSIEFRFTR